MTDPILHTPEISSPQRRFRPGARFCFVAAVLFLLLVRLIWGFHASQRLALAIAAAKADGTLFEPEQFNSPAVEASVNAVTYIRKAMDAQAQDADSPRMSNLSYSEFPPYPAAWHELMEVAIPKNQECLKLLREARGYSQVDWGGQFQSPVSPDFRGLNKMRSLANLLGDAAIYHHLQGNDSEALACIRDIIHLADVVKRQGNLVAYLVGVGIDAVAYTSLQIISVHATFDAPARTQARELINELTRTDTQAHYQRAMQFERMLAYDMANQKAQKVWAMRPALHLEMARDLEYMNQLVKATLLAWYQQSRNAVPPVSVQKPITA